MCFLYAGHYCTLDPLCLINDCVNGTENFLLICHTYDEDRRDILNSVDAILRRFDPELLSKS